MDLFDSYDFVAMATVNRLLYLPIEGFVEELTVGINCSGGPTHSVWSCILHTVRTQQFF